MGWFRIFSIFQNSAEGLRTLIRSEKNEQGQGLALLVLVTLIPILTYKLDLIQEK
mgnify:CR=1 FL=1